MEKTQYRPSSRSWIKLWVNEWLTGTVRWELTPEQRSIWADLLALAGRSRFPGFVCSGETNGKLSPFPMDYLCSVFRCAETDVSAAFILFTSQGRITVKEGVIEIINWDKYQSEYQQKRQRTVYKNTAENLANVRTKSAVEGEVEVDGEKRDKNTRNPGAKVPVQIRKSKSDPIAERFVLEENGDLRCKDCNRGVLNSRAATKQHSYSCPKRKSA